MATIYDQVKAQVDKCNVTLLTPVDVSKYELSLCRTKCAAEEYAEDIARISAVSDAINQIETLTADANGDPVIDVNLFLADTNDRNIVFRVYPTGDGDIRMELNASHTFYANNIVNSVPDTLVPTTVTDSNGNTVPKDPYVLENERKSYLRQHPKDILDVAVIALNSEKSKIDAIIAKLEEIVQ